MENQACSSACKEVRDDIAGDVGVADETAKRWLQVFDTGLVAYLTENSKLH